MTAGKVRRHGQCLASPMLYPERQVGNKDDIMEASLYQAKGKALPSKKTATQSNSVDIKRGLSTLYTRFTYFDISSYQISSSVIIDQINPQIHGLFPGEITT